VYECFGGVHVCDHCHDYEQLKKLINFDKPEPYPNLLPLAEYDPHPISKIACTPETCKFGGNHPPNGIEYSMGCTKCREEQQGGGGAGGE